MSKHHHQSKEEQIYSKVRGAASFNRKRMPHEASNSMQSEDIQTNAAVDDRSIQLRAYQIYREKGGPALDNWLEAERIIGKRA